MSKLILDESLDMPEKLDIKDFNKRKELYESRKLKEEVSPEEAQMAINSMISSLIQSKWQAIDQLNGNITMLQQYDRPDVSEVLQAMISDNYIHIGQLEKLLELNNSGAVSIEAGKENIEDVVKATDDLDAMQIGLDDIEVEESIEESKGFLENYKSGKIHDAGDCYVATNKHGTTLGSSKTVVGAESYIDELDRKEDGEIEFPADDVPENLVDEIDFKKGAIK